MNATEFILASASPRRSQLLGYLDLDFVVLPAKSVESAGEHLTPREVCLLNAWRKARKVARKHPDALVLGADTVVSLDTDVLGKPADMGEAGETLRRLQGRSHFVTTGVCLMHLRTHVERVFSEATRVKFRILTDDQIERYLKCINPLDKAGAYAIQEKGEMVVEAVEGSFTNVIGLPLAAVESELLKVRELVELLSE